MADVAADNWVIVLILLVVVVLAAWWLLSVTRKTRIERAETSSDETLARRNQALIDAPRGSPDVDVPPTTPEGIAGAGAAVAAAAEPVHEHPAISADDLKQIKGIGPKLEKLLNSLGVTSYAQIAAWNSSDIDSIDAQLGTFQGRIRRDDWPAQARLLAAGDKAAFEDRFGRL